MHDRQKERLQGMFLEEHPLPADYLRQMVEHMHNDIEPIAEYVKTVTNTGIGDPAPIQVAVTVVRDGSAHSIKVAIKSWNTTGPVGRPFQLVGSGAIKELANENQIPELAYFQGTPLMTVGSCGIGVLEPDGVSMRPSVAVPIGMAIGPLPGKGYSAVWLFHIGQTGMYTEIPDWKASGANPTAPFIGASKVVLLGEPAP